MVVLPVDGRKLTSILRRAILVRLGTVLILRTESTVKVYGGF
jgi:hypothetical protein